MDYFSFNTIKNLLKEEKLRLENIIIYIIVAITFLLPIFIIPSLSAPFQATKAMLVFLGVFVAFFLFIISKLKNGEISLPKNMVVISAWALPAAYLISALFSKNLGISLVGHGLETDTFGFILVMVLMFSLITFVFKNKKHALYLYLVFLISFGILSLYLALRMIFGTDFLSFGVLNNPTSNLLGKWNDLAIFFGLSTILSYTALELLKTNKWAKIKLYSILAISLFFLVVINFFPIWLAIGLIALGFFVHSIIRNHSTGANKKRISIRSLLILVLAFVFIIGGDQISNYTYSLFNITQIEARPSWQSTIEIGKEVYKENMIFGSGPNTFVEKWTLLKPREINDTIFWNIDFTSGIGFIPTSFITTGIVGGIAWILFLGLLLWSGIKRFIFSRVEDRFTYYISLSSFIGSVYLWTLSIVYVPNSVILSLAFIMTGIYVASGRFYPEGLEEKKIEFSSNPRLGFVFILLLTVMILASVAALYTVSVRYLSILSFQRGIIEFNISGNLDKAEQGISRAISLYKRDTYYRFASDANLVRLGEIVSKSATPTETQRAQFQLVLARAIENAQAATQVNKNNYLNWLTLGRVYQSVVPLRIEGAYINAKNSYEKALELHPKGAAIYLALAQLAADNSDLTEAREYITKTLEQKFNYTSAIFLLAQIDIQEGNIPAAINSVEAATLLSPNNPVLFFQLGLLQYNEGYNTRAITALEQATALDSAYSNARYFLGLSYYRVGRTDDAIAEFKKIEALNPDNQDVKLILSNFEAGKNPFTGTSASSSVGDRDGLPVEE